MPHRALSPLAPQFRRRAPKPTTLKPLEGVEVMRGEMPVTGLRTLLRELVKSQAVARTATGIFDEAGRYLAPAQRVDPIYAAHVASSVGKHAQRVPLKGTGRDFADAQVAKYLRRIR
jgi:hypothetical protein